MTFEKFSANARVRKRVGENNLLHATEQEALVFHIMPKIRVKR
jgi:hypothetical protein